MKILFWGTYDKSKPRIRLLLKGLKNEGVEVKECHFSIWENILDKSQISSKFRLAVIAVRLLLAYPLLFCKQFTYPRPDVLIVAYPALIDVYIALIYAKLFKIPIVWDVFISMYNTIVEDRKLLPRHSLLARLIFLLEKLALNSVNCVVLDTKTHGAYLTQKYNINTLRVSFVYVGAEMDLFPSKKCTKQHSPLRILFYGQFIPLHGIDKIIQAAAKMNTDKYTWTLIGEGQESDKISKMLATKPLKNLEWISWVNYNDLIKYIHNADICLGIFGDSIKTQLVIPNKVFQIITANKPFVTLDTPAMRELFPQESAGLKYVQGNRVVDLIHAVEKLEISYASLPDNLFIKQKQKITPSAIANSYKKILCNVMLERENR